MVTILMMSAKLTTPSLLKIKIFRDKDYDVMIPDNDKINRIFSPDSNYIVDMAMWPKFGNPSVSVRKVIITSNL